MGQPETHERLILDYLEIHGDAPIEEARGLPNEAFTSQQYFEAEQRHLFARSWVFAGTLSDIPGGGDIKPVSVGGRPLVLVRDRNREPRVFFNVCAHRGAQLVDTACKAQRAMVCPYHRWTYGLDGKLKGRPHFHGPNQHDKPGDGSGEKPELLPVRFGLWEDWIFVNIDRKALPFEEFIEPLRCRYEGYPLHDLHLGNVRRYTFHSNWKLTVENWCDNYHLFAIHPALDKTMEHESRRSMGRAGPHIFCQYGFIGDSDTGIEPTGEGLDLPRGQCLSDAFSNTAGLGAIFPNVALLASPTSFLFTQINPIAVDQCEMVVHFYYHSKEAATGDGYAAARDALEAQWTNLNEEDMSICHRTQVGRACDDFDGGRFAPNWDDGHVHLHRQFADALAGQGIFASVEA